MFASRGFILSPLLMGGLLLLSGAFPLAIKAQTLPPVLVSEPTSTRAIALESVTFVPEPFSTTSPNSWNADHRTRIIVFALNLPPTPAAGSVTADAEDAAHHHVNLVVEYAGAVPNQPWLTAISLLLSDDLHDAGDVLIRIVHQGTSSNRVRVAMGHKGGGPPDDTGAGPTPAPPYSVSGKVSAGASGLGGMTLRISGSETGTLVTDSNGAYQFLLGTAGGTYTITPENPLYDFTPASRTFNYLTNNQTDTNFVASRRRYAISGRVFDASSQALSGVTVALTGGEQRTVTSDGAGNFSFPNLNAGENYTIAPSLLHYAFTPLSQSFNHLDADRTIDFRGGLRNYLLSGKVADNAGEGLAGITISLNGSQSGTFQTGSDGTYSIALTALGSYTLTPSIEQDWYAFGPLSESVVNLTSDRTVNFTATPRADTGPAYVLEFDGSAKTVDYGYFWDPYIDLGHFFWEFWAMPGSNAGATYMLSDGYGGAHALLFGFANLSTSDLNHYQLIGDIFDGVKHDNYFTSDEGPAPGEWGHFAVGWDGQNIITYMNGVPIGKSPFAGPRRTPGPGGGASWLLIGGSTHSNFDGRIAQVRGYEQQNPREDPAGVDRTLVESTFAPQTIFNRGGNLTSHYFRASPTVADLSQGYGGRSRAGVLRGLTYGYFDPCTGCALPAFVVDPTAPDFINATAPPPTNAGAPAPVPTGALVFDSFSRANATYVLNGIGGLGATEGGTAGAKVWQTNRSASERQAFGILNGRAVMLGNETAVTWITPGSTSGNLEIQVNRNAGRNNSGLDTGLSFRVLDEQNFFFAYTSAGADAASARKLTVGFYLNGQRVNLASGINLPPSWTTLIVVTRTSGEFSVFAGNSLLYTTTNGNLVKATGCGLYNNSPGLGLVNRWDTFTVLDAP